MYTDQAGLQPHPAPGAMTEHDIRATVDDFAHAARSAIAAGFDGVELHAANGYLIEQFLNTASNHRADGYGGSVAGRLRFVREVAAAAAGAIGADRVGIRISPYGANGGMVADPATDELYGALADALTALGLLYLHVVDHSAMGAPPVPSSLKADLRARWKGAYILSGGYDRARADADLAAGKGDLVAFGRPFLANPDLVAKLAHGGAVRAPDPATFYTPGEHGYTDWPTG
jgi:N-ethylmaleimide reductase